MATGYNIPGGKKKGTPLDQAEPADIRYWMERIQKDLESNPEKQYADRDRAWVRAAQAEIAKRGNGTAAPQTSTRQAAPATQGQSQALARTGTAAPARISVDTVHDPVAATRRLREHAATMHLVTPATSVDAIPAGCGVALSMVHVDPNTEKDGPGDVVKIGDKLMLSANALARVAAAAGIDWDPQRSGRLDNGRDPHYCHYRAVGFVRNFDGSVRTVTGEVEMDAREGSPQIEEIREKAEKRRQEHPDWKNDGGASQILELRKFLLRHAETKAKNRAIVNMGLKRTYTARELEKPFAVARLMWTGQTSDPELRREFARMGAERMLARMGAERMLAGNAALYGATQHAPPARLAAPAQPAASALPAWAGHEPPPIGGGTAEDYDFSEYEIDTAGEEAPSSPSVTANHHDAPPAAASNDY